jgi:hypothetical protein
MTIDDMSNGLLPSYLVYEFVLSAFEIQSRKAQEQKTSDDQLYLPFENLLEKLCKLEVASIPLLTHSNIISKVFEGNKKTFPVALKYRSLLPILKKIGTITKDQ